MAEDVQPPTAWLWSEIERRYGVEEAEQLRAAYNKQLQRYGRQQLLEKYRKDIPRLEARIAVAEQRGNEEALIRNYERQIAHRRKRLQEGWPDAAAGGGEATIRLKLFWGDSHGGIEHIWEGDYDPALGEAVGHAGGDVDETITVELDGDRVRITGGSFDSEQTGRIWRRTEKRIEVAFSAE